jgi:phenylacetate-CoA ligase
MEEGDVVVTDLYNFGMPFIRYVIGDRAVAGFGVCSCGRGLPTLRAVVGRQLDVLVTRDGRRLPGELFPHLLKDFPAVRRFQVVQESEEMVVLRLVLAPGAPSPADPVAREARTYLGPTMRFAVEEVDDIPLSRSGKLQVVVNKAGGRVQSS